MDNMIIFGGTFDPVHKGHLIAAEHAVTELKASQCIWVPNKIPLLKNQAQATIQQRLDMLTLALKQSSQGNKFRIDRCEIDRSGPSYSVDTLQYFRKQYGMNQSLSLLMGEDSFVKLNQWHQWQTIINLAHIIVVTRPSHTSTWPEHIQALFRQHRCHTAEALTDKPFGSIYQIKLDVDISSTDIRNHLSQSPILTKICPESVAEYIERHGLYTHH